MPGLEPSPISWVQSLERHLEAIRSLPSNLDPAEVDDARCIMASCKELLVFTGVGQNGLLAAKAASTFNSLAIRSMFVDPVALLHGQMGLLRESDVIVAISKSGNTEELITVIDACHRIGFTSILGIHSNRGSKLHRLSRWSMYVPVLAEADHLDLAPTASSVCYLALLQSIAVHIAGQRGLTKVEFVRTHPGGTLGKEPVDCEVV